MSRLFDQIIAGPNKQIIRALMTNVRDMGGDDHSSERSTDVRFQAVDDSRCVDRSGK
jgi:hypothetical protein